VEVDGDSRLVGIVCAGETYKNFVKMTFAKGAALNDPSGLFNSSLDGDVRRAIGIHEGDEVDEAALKDFIRAAVALNLMVKRKPKPGERATSGPTSFIEVPAISPRMGEGLRHLPHTPSSSASRPRSAVLDVKEHHVEERWHHRGIRSWRLGGAGDCGS
jgi:hypothetical protein